MADDTTPAETTAIFAELNETLRQVQESMTAIAGAVNQNVTLSEKERAERQKLIDQAKNDDSLKRTNDLLKEYGVTLEKVTNGDKQRVDVVKQTIDEEKAARNSASSGGAKKSKGRKLGTSMADAAALIEDDN